VANDSAQIHEIRSTDQYGPCELIETGIASAVSR
jgi:hypothetical protein